MYMNTKQIFGISTGIYNSYTCIISAFICPYIVTKNSVRGIKGAQSTTNQSVVIISADLLNFCGIDLGGDKTKQLLWL